MSGKNVSKTRKTVPYPVRLTQSEAQAFDKISEQAGLKRSQYLRKIIREVINNEPDLTDIEFQEFKKAIITLSGISRNLNQLTRAVNSGKFPDKLLNTNYYSELNDNVINLKESLTGYVNSTKIRWVKG